jgi:hypothetical protein
MNNFLEIWQKYFNLCQNGKSIMIIPMRVFQLNVPYFYLLYYIMNISQNVGPNESYIIP